MRLLTIPLFGSFLSRLLMPLCFAPPDVGAGAGGGTGDGSPAGGGIASSAPGAGVVGGGAPAGGSGAAQPFAWSDDAQVRLPDGRTIRAADYRTELQREIDTEYKGRYSRGFETLISEAKRIDALARARSGGNGADRGGQSTDPFASIRDMAIVDGPTMHRLITQLQQQGLGPLANVVSQLQRQNQELVGKFTEFGQRFGSQDEDRAAQDFEGRLDKALPTVTLKNLDGAALDPRNEAFREAARALYLSYKPDSWKTGEFEKMYGDMMNSLYDAFRQLQSSHTSTAQQRLRESFNPNRGGGRPSGDAKYKFENPRELAAKARDAGMFGGVGRT